MSTHIIQYITYRFNTVIHSIFHIFQYYLLSHVTYTIIVISVCHRHSLLILIANLPMSLVVVTETVHTLHLFNYCQGYTSFITILPVKICRGGYHILFVHVTFYNSVLCLRHIYQDQLASTIPLTVHIRRLSNCCQWYTLCIRILPVGC